MLGIVLLLPIFSLADISQWQVQDYWGKLEPRMTEQVVMELLGKPLVKEAIDSQQIWYYQQMPEREGDRVVNRPRHGFLRFRKNDSACLLFDWKEPDWAITVPLTERQYLTELRKIEIRQEIEDAKRLAEEQRRARALQAENEKIERVASAFQIEQEKIQRKARASQVKHAAIKPSTQREQYKHRTQTTAAASRNRPQAKIPAAKADTSVLTTSHYFLIIGGVFVLIAFAIAFSQGFRMFND